MSVCRNSFYIVANYTSSSSLYFPDNKPQQFRVKLSKPIDLKGSLWKIALCEIILKDIVPLASETGTYPSLYSVEFTDSSGLCIHGNSSHSLRVIPKKSDAHMIFNQPYYLPIATEYLDTFEISINNLEGYPLRVNLSDDALITCTLHFRRT